MTHESPIVGHVPDETVIAAIADPSRRALLDALRARDGQTVTELGACLPQLGRHAVLKHIKKDAFILAGFSFGASLAAKLAERERPEWLVLVGVGITRIMAPPVPPGTLVIHGENDDTVPLAAVLDWARPQDLPVVVVPGADHFFHRKLQVIKQVVLANRR